MLIHREMSTNTTVHPRMGIHIDMDIRASADLSINMYTSMNIGMD